MLYKNEVIRPYDPETGTELSDLAAQLSDEETREAIAAGLALEEMTRSKGWEICDNFLKSMIERYRDVLTTETDFEKLKRIQEAIKCYQSLLNYIEWRIHDAKRLQLTPDPAFAGQSKE